MGVTGPVRLLLDENMDHRLVPVLRQQGVDVRVLREFGLLGADDPAILQVALSQGCVLVTRDHSDFPGLTRSSIARGARCPPVLLVPSSFHHRDVGKTARALMHWVRTYEPGQAPLSEGITWLTLAPEDRPAGGRVREAAPPKYASALRRAGIELPSIV
jgi:predicted nuclease of predicted toxin-antitoxin system